MQSTAAVRKKDGADGGGEGARVDLRKEREVVRAVHMKRCANIGVLIEARLFAGRNARHHQCCRTGSSNCQQPVQSGHHLVDSNKKVSNQGLLEKEGLSTLIQKRELFGLEFTTQTTTRPTYSNQSNGTHGCVACSRRAKEVGL